LAQRELLQYEDAINTIKHAMELDPENESIKELYNDMKTEHELDNTLPPDHPEKLRFGRML
jgi:hypothetical protein